MGNAILTINIGNFLRDNSRDSFQAAARRWACDYIEITEVPEGVHPHAIKLKAFELCDASRIFFIDGDTVVSAGCPSPFEMFPEDAFVAVSNQQGHMTESCLNACADTISRELLAIAAVINESPISHPTDFVNSGVWLASRKYHRTMLLRAYGIALTMQGKLEWLDQSSLNYVLLKDGIPVLMAPPAWNYQFPPDTGQEPMEQFVYHWAGGEKRDQIPGVNWRSFRAMQIESVKIKPKLLVIADHCCPTGFARVAENVCKYLRNYWDISVIGINYNGTPHNFPYRIWPAKLYGDIWGLGTYKYILPDINPDAILIIQDPWIVARFVTEIDRCGIPMAAYMPVDAKNQHPETAHKLNNLDLAIFYTQFGEIQIRLAGYKGPSRIIPHGVDADLYRPISQAECRSRIQLFDGKDEFTIPQNAFIVGNVNRNQPRKRLDLTVQYFAEWIRRVAGDPRQRINDAYLYLHCAQQENAGLDLPELAYYYGIGKRLIIPDADVVTPRKGLSEDEMAQVYGSFDVQVTTTAGEGFGLPQIEGMACGVPQIVPQFGALAEWAAGVAYMVPCSEQTAHPVINTVGAVPEKEAFIRALDMFYRKPELRVKYAERALARARESQFRWESIADRFNSCLHETILDARARAEKRETERKEKETHAEVSKEEPVAATA